MIDLAEARRVLLAACPLLEPVGLDSDDADGCVLAADVIAPGNVPPFDNSSVDGYAVRAADVAGAAQSSPVRLDVLGSVMAGSVADRPVGPGQTWKVMTGAPVPEGADAVVMVERTSATRTVQLGTAGDVVEVLSEVAAGAGTRRAGSDVRAGELVLGAGTVLRPAHLGVLASVGAWQVSGYRRLQVGVLVTGDELVTGGAELRPGQIYESNRAMLLALLRRANCEPVDLGVAGDDVTDLQSRLSSALERCDAVLTSGGVSMGDSDPVRAVLDRFGGLNWLQVAIRPAKPFAFGVLPGPRHPVPVLGLPGNPVSALVSYELLARPALRQMMGHADPYGRVVLGVADAPLPRPHGDGRTAYLRVSCRFGPDGRLHARPVSGQDSHQLSASASADGLAQVEDGRRVEAGDEVPVHLLS
ncbi:MAG TPA: gephyrin-like molybdotransferase Glp [Jatrophihabitans sp.]|jgi:molybdenum cofactor synthesis domain-containing protein|uniref:molybdopterin molybdotransferase MoeA n=1 Tax=Jatrophihabitans sp. TaxID=1932789 RepID=UPI002EE6BE83